MKVGQTVVYEGSLEPYRGMGGKITEIYKTGLCKGRVQIEFFTKVIDPIDGTELDGSLTCAKTDLRIK